MGRFAFAVDFNIFRNEPTDKILVIFLFCRFSRGNIQNMKHVQDAGVSHFVHSMQVCTPFDNVS